MQSGGQYDDVESTALAKEDRADNSDVPKIQRESIRTRRERLHDMRVNIERTPTVDTDVRGLASGQVAYIVPLVRIAPRRHLSFQFLGNLGQRSLRPLATEQRDGSTYDD
jgi:hypothetical protein